MFIRLLVSDRSLVRGEYIRHVSEREEGVEGGSLLIWE